MEGVERVEQADCLRGLGCDSAMGWLWSAALPPDELAECAVTGFPMGGAETRGVVVPLRARAERSSTVPGETGGGGGNRTRVEGFANLCLCHSATPPDPGD